MMSREAISRQHDGVLGQLDGAAAEALGWILPANENGGHCGRRFTGSDDQPSIGYPSRHSDLVPADPSDEALRRPHERSRPSDSDYWR
jgi:hypothetical protein